MRCGIPPWVTTCVHCPRPCSDEQAPDPCAHGASEASRQVEPTADASSMKFTIHATDGAARAATLELAHGKVETPVFMPVGTYGAVKAVSPAELVENGTRIVLGNTFHLWLRPGLEAIAAHGGLHR